jgi:transposase
MQTTKTVGLDIAKSVFQVHGVDADGNVVVRRQLKRRYVLTFFQKLPPCLVGIEACASSHYWSRELQALGHTVRLMPPAYVKPYVKRHKNDAADAEAICEAVTRRTNGIDDGRLLANEQMPRAMKHQAALLFGGLGRHKAHVSHLAEFGIVAPVGRRGVEQLLKFVADANDTRLPEIARACVAALGAQLLALKARILAFDRRIMAAPPAALQLPVGIWLDRYGPRRVEGVLLLFAAAGAMLFSLSKGFAALVLGRALIGFGVAAAFTGGLKAIVLWFPKDRVAAMNGWMVMLGALGALSATSRPSCCSIGAEAGADCSRFSLPNGGVRADDLGCRPRSEIRQAVVELAHTHRPEVIYSDTRFWELAPLSATCAGTAWA